MEGGRGRCRGGFGGRGGGSCCGCCRFVLEFIRLEFIRLEVIRPFPLRLSCEVVPVVVALVRVVEKFLPLRRRAGFALDLAFAFTFAPGYVLTRAQRVCVCLGGPSVMRGRNVVVVVLGVLHAG